MRYILFRAKAINRIDGYEYRTNYKNGDWVYGTISQFPIKHYGRLISEMKMTNTDGVSNIDVDERTLGQYSGIDDKNGTKIFEHDIVRAKYKEVRDFQGVKYDTFMEFNELIIFKKGQFMLEINNCGIKMYRPLVDFFKINNIEQVELEVIGNKFDNYELLEQIY